MFCEFYGLSEQPFGVTPNPRYVYSSKTHHNVLHALIAGIESDLGFAALTAEPGLGKTTLLFSLLERFRSVSRTALIFNTQCSSADLLRCLATEFEIASPAHDLVVLHEQIKDVLVKEAEDRRRVLLIIDEAHNLRSSVLEAVRLLSNFETPETKLLHIILAGQPQLAKRLSEPRLSHLAQRIAIFSKLQPLAPEEVIEYLDHRLRIAGYDHDIPLFTPEAAREIAIQSEGIPRKINRLGFHALSRGYHLRQRRIGADIVQKVSSDLAGMTNSCLLSPEASRSTHEKAHRFTLRQTADTKESLQVRQSRFEGLDSGSSYTQPSEPTGTMLAIGRESEAKSNSDLDKMRAKPSASPTAGESLQFKSNEQRSAPFTLPKPIHEPRDGLTIPGGERETTSHARALGVVGGNEKGSDFHERTLDEEESSCSPKLLTIISVVLLAVIGSILFLYWKAGDVTQSPRVEDRREAAASTSAEVKNSARDESKIQVPATAQNLTQNGAPYQPRERTTAETPAAVIAARKSVYPIRDLQSEPPPPADIVAHSATVKLPELLAAPSAIKSPTVSGNANKPTAALSGGKLISATKPLYPIAARSGNIQGVVLLNVVVGPNGTIEKVSVISGHPLLAPAAVNAVKQWRYEPFLTNNKPVRSETHIQVRFTLSPENQSDTGKN
jgi:general secretion pathway protein A